MQIEIRTVLRRRLLVSSLVMVGVAGTGTMATAAHAAPRPALGRVTAIELIGHGDGPGVGLGQWGAFGDAVRYHFGYERILAHFYGGSASANLATLGAPTDPVIRVAVLENANLTTNVGYDPVVTSPSDFTVTAAAGVSTPAPPSTTVPTTAPTTSAPTTSAPTTTTPTTTTLAATPPVVGVASPGTTFVVPGGSAVDLRLQPNGTWSAYEGSSCGAAQAALVASATDLLDPVMNPTSGSPIAAPSQLLTLCRHDGVDESLRGSIEAYDRSGYARTVNLVPLQAYLDGVVLAEVSPAWGFDGGTVGAPQGAAWGFQALEAQAVASRSYVLASAANGGWNGYADVCDTSTCQSYVGADYEAATTDAAVSDTVGEVRVAATGNSAGNTVLSTQFSASTGGWTAPGAFPAVRDPGDACVALSVPAECNPDHSWQVRVPVGVITRHYPAIGRLLRLHVATRNDFGALGGRALSVRIGGSKATITVSGAAFAAVTGLRSDWFAIAHLERAGAAAAPAATTITASPAAAP